MRFSHRNGLSPGYSIGRQVEWECVLSKILAGECEEEFGVEKKQETTLSCLLFLILTASVTYCRVGKCLETENCLN